MTSHYTKAFFDFDSTLIDCESLDLIAEKKAC
jgi:phosphoserine phosphatase